MTPARTGDLVCIRRMGIPILVEVTEVLTETAYNTGYIGRVVGSEIVPYQVEFLHSDLVPCPGTNMEPIFADVAAPDPAAFIRAETQRRLSQRNHTRPLPTHRYYRAHDMELLFRVLRNMILLRLQEVVVGESNGDSSPDLSWCIRMDTLMLRVDAAVYETLQQRLNEQVLAGLGFRVIYLGVDPTMGDEYIGIVLEETELSLG